MSFFANTGAVQLSIRRARKADLDRLVEIHAACYPDERTAAQRRLNFVQNAFAKLADLHVAEQAGHVVGHGRGFALKAWFGGRPVQTVGIASVGVAPEARGMGVGSAIVSGIEKHAQAGGAVLSMLHAYRHAFYAKRGYAEVTPMKRLELSPLAIPHAWVEQARAAPLAAAGAKNAQAIVKLYRRAITRLTGCIERSEARWTRLFTNERVHSVVLENAGYVMFEYLQQEPHAQTRIEVHDLVAQTGEARHTLWGFLGLQAGQISEIEVEVADDDPITFALTDVDGGRFGDERVEHALGCLVAGPMVRMLDPRRALAARGWGGDGKLDLVVSGEAMHLSVRNGRATVSTIHKPKRALVTSARTLASIAFGSLRVTGAKALGLIEGDDASITRADAMFRIPSFVTLDRF